MKTFEEMIARVIAIEGGLSMDPDDPGNWTGGAKFKGELRGTKFGISAKQYPYIEIKSLSREDAIAIYRRDYFDGPGIAKLPLEFQFLVLDAIVHHGPGSSKPSDDGAIRFFQRALGVPDVGQIGPVTIAAARDSNPLLVAARMLGERLNFMTYTKTWSLNSRGFARRVAKHLMGLQP